MDHDRMSRAPDLRPPEYGLLGISLPEDAHLSLAGRIYSGIREAIVAGRIVSDQRLPSTRALAEDLGVARGTVVEAYEQLQVEGYVRTERGAGTFVDEIPERFLQAPAVTGSSVAEAVHPRTSRRAAPQHVPIVDYSQARKPRPFQPGLPPLDAFPRHLFARLTAETMRGLSFDDLAYGDAGGYYPLRQAIASYLATARAVKCEPEQVIVTNGTQHALSLAAHILLDPGEPVWMENPGYRGAAAAFVKAGLEIVPVPVEADGISIEEGRRRAPQVRLIYVTPSHQYPLGITMSARRRLELIEWASRSDAWIIEDDYDSEYRYDGAPLPALHHFDPEGRVIYIGSFSKVLAPGLRLGYVVVPKSLANLFTRTRSADDHHSTITTQMVLARFIEGGHFGRHLRKLRRIGEARRDVLVRSVARRLPHLSLSGTEGGLHALLRLDPSFDDGRLAAVAAEQDLSLSPLSAYDLEADAHRGFVLGYAAYTEKQIDAAVAGLAKILAPGSEGGSGTVIL